MLIILFLLVSGSIFGNPAQQGFARMEVVANKPLQITIEKDIEFVCLTCEKQRMEALVTRPISVEVIDGKVVCTCKESRSKNTSTMHIPSLKAMLNKAEVTPASMVATSGGLVSQPFRASLRVFTKNITEANEWFDLADKLEAGKNVPIRRYSQILQENNVIYLDDKEVIKKADQKIDQLSPFQGTAEPWKQVPPHLIPTCIIAQAGANLLSEQEYKRIVYRNMIFYLTDKGVSKVPLCNTRLTTFPLTARNTTVEVTAAALSNLLWTELEKRGYDPFVIHPQESEVSKHLKSIAKTVAKPLTQSLLGLYVVRPAYDVAGQYAGNSMDRSLSIEISFDDFHL